MKPLLVAAILCLAAGAAQAKIPFFNATCATTVEVHADEGGPVYIDGKEAKIKKYNNDAYDATLGHTTISITINPDGSVMAMYTGKGGANGVCTVQE